MTSGRRRLEGGSNEHVGGWLQRRMVAPGQWQGLLRLDGSLMRLATTQGAERSPRDG